jgi:hypothetical protein
MGSRVRGTLEDKKHATDFRGEQYLNKEKNMRTKMSFVLAVMCFVAAWFSCRRRSPCGWQRYLRGHGRAVHCVPSSVGCFENVKLDG